MLSMVIRGGKGRSGCPIPHPLSGKQHTLMFADYAATFASVGASLRTLQYRGRDLVRPFPADDLRPGYSGAILAPWPNRVKGGSYDYNGLPRQLAINEPSLGHALHGLVAWSHFVCKGRTSSSLVFAASIEPQDGFPHRLDIEVEYCLSDDGLSTLVRTTHSGGSTAPFGISSHNYLVAGPGKVDDWTLRLPAQRVLLVDDSMMPTHERAVSNRSEFDFRQPRTLAHIRLDHAFTSLVPDADGCTHVTLQDVTGSGVKMSWRDRLPWVQVHTGDLINDPRSRTGLAVEPMSCPPNAFNSGRDLIHLIGGETHTAQWHISAILPGGLPGG